MKKLLSKIEDLMRNNARHRKGSRINELTVPQIFNHLHGEICEFYDVVTNPLARNNELAAAQEMADCFGIMYHLMVRFGWQPKDIEEIAIQKLNERFTK